MSETRDWGDEPSKDGGDVLADKSKKENGGPPPGWRPLSETIRALSGEAGIEVDLEDHPEIQAAFKRFPRLKEEIVEVTRLYCDPRLHHCEFEEGRLYYDDPESGKRRQLKRLSEPTGRPGSGSQRVIFEGPTEEDTVIKLSLTGYANQSEEELGCYLEATSEERKKLVSILGFRRMRIGANEDSLVLLEERVNLIEIGERRLGEQDLVRDIQLLEGEPDHYREEVMARYGLASLEQLRGSCAKLSNGA